MKLLLDTNVLVAALVARGTCRSLRCVVKAGTGTREPARLTRLIASIEKGVGMRVTLLAILGVLLGGFAAPGRAQAPAPDSATLAKTGILERLAARSGVYAVPPTAKTPSFIADAGWPQKLPHNWILGQVGGLYVAPDDHIWIYQRPRTLTNDEAALTDATDKRADGKAVDVMGFPRPYGALGDCCRAGARGHGVRCGRHVVARVGRPSRSRQV